MSEYKNNSNVNDRSSNCEESDSGSDIVVRSHRVMQILSDSDDNDDNNYFSDTEDVPDCENIDVNLAQFTCLPPDTQYNKQTPNVFFELPGPKHTPPGDAKPIDFFDLFFTAPLIKKMVVETNRYAAQFVQNHPNLKPQSRAKLWKPVTIPEMRGFIAVILEMGITRRPTIFSYWMKGSRCIPWFARMFARNRFQLLLKFFHLVDNKTLAPCGHPEYDPCARFQVLVDHANLVFRQHYIPHQQLSIDESLVGTNAHTGIKQYIPSKKHHQWGIKFWMLCDSLSKYCLGFFCYRGAKSKVDKDEIKEKGLGFLVVEKLLSMGNYLNKGYHLFTDNFYTSVELARFLYQKTTYLTGTIRRNRKLVPKEAKTVPVNEPKYFTNDPVLMCSFREKKSKKNPVILISTCSDTANVSVTKKRGNYESIKNKPSMIHTYNQFMGGVDESDKMLYTYLDERKTLKFWKKVVFAVFGRMLLNAYILYSEKNIGKKMTRLKFTTSIIEDLEEKWLLHKNRPETATPSTSSPQSFGLEKLPGRNLRRCVVCSSKDYSAVKRSNLICARCKKGLHGVCAVKHTC